MAGVTASQFEQHMKDDKSFQESTVKFQDSIGRDISAIKENHLSHIESDMARVSNDVSWLVRFFWIVATAAIGGLIMGVLDVVKNGV